MGKCKTLFSGLTFLKSKDNRIGVIFILENCIVLLNGEVKENNSTTQLAQQACVSFFLVYLF